MESEWIRTREHRKGPHFSAVKSDVHPVPRISIRETLISMEEQYYLHRTAVAVLGNAWSYRAGCRLRASVIYSAETRRTRAEKILYTYKNQIRRIRYKFQAKQGVYSNGPNAMKLPCTMSSSRYTGGGIESNVPILHMTRGKRV